jgi:hypothetical protein
LVADEHAFAVVERIDNHGAGVAQAYLEDGLMVLPPPFLADGCVVRTEGEEVSRYWEGARDFGDTFYEGDVGCG